LICITVQLDLSRHLFLCQTPQRTGEIYDNEITSLIDIYFLRISFIPSNILDTLSDVLESVHAYR
jgi:hypothetical protein